jgi:SAM-dependent methyltransferase
MLDLGTGEGELDPLLSRFTEHLDACDVNEHDVEHARQLNSGLGNVHYAVEHAEKLSHPDDCFDAVVCSEVLEHVEDPHALLAEVGRVLRPGGYAVFTFPSQSFPALYDPLNFLLARSGRHLRIGAYGYGHQWLVREARMNVWLEDHGFEVKRLVRLSRHLAGLLECYLPGLLQRVLKANSGNAEKPRPGRFVLRPSLREPGAVALTDALVRLDERILPRTRSSIGLGYVVQRRAG